MAEASDKQAIFTQNLIDAGCDTQTIALCTALAKANKGVELLQILAKKKAGMLNTIHESQKQIDCLDYLVYQINRGNLPQQLIINDKL